MTSFWSPGTTQSSPSRSECSPRRPNTSRIIRRSWATQLSIRSSPPVTPARAMNEAISMWSGETVCSQPPRRSAPWTSITLEPIPVIAAPMRLSMRATSWTCGSEAALRMIVVPGVSAAAIRAFSVPITDGSSMKKSQATRPPSGATRRMSRPCSTWAPSARNASRCGSRRRRPITSPPGGGSSASPQRASSGPPTSTDARMRSASVGSASVVRMFAARSATVLPSRRSISTPRSASSASMASTSRMCGMLCSTTCSSVSRLHASSGSAAFLFPAGRMAPHSGTPPSMTNFSMRGGCGAGERGSAGPGSWARVTAMTQALSRDEAWSLFCEWTQSPSLRKHVLAVEAAMRAYARRFGEDEELWGLTGLLHDLDYERYPDLETGHPRYALKELEARGYPREIIDAVAGHADFMDVPRTTRLAKTLYGVDELSGFVAACALVRPTGIEGMKPKSVRKKLKQPSFAAKVDRNQIRRGIEELGGDETEHIQLVIDAMAANASELGLEPQASAPEDG